MSKVVIISGSPSPSSRLNGIVQYAEQFLERAGFVPERITVVELPAEALIHAKFGDPAIIAANKLVEEADAVIVATPVYKASFTGAIKTYLDLLPQKGLAGKVILPLALGGTFGHYLMLDYALKPVLSALGGSKILSGVFVLDTQVDRTEDLQFSINDSQIIERLDTTLHNVAAELRVDLTL
ncbi:NADPH-dependent FMN reductase [Paenibacillus sp. IB182496]|uniref:NADPH-dependent FMN reductase n=1 Tax=Paenibacillus sabuli TaxID=2772509 RepID=A0A927BTZ7_9BACL|nr:NADPH-dependent FMN reductase [Paenibacillus sabuli]MBD2845363.1 NADPH-dependent FMN reductase [Paenibacillus sabuli]